MTEKYTEELGKKIYKLILQISILLYIKKDVEEKKQLIKEQKNLEEELIRMENKKEYLQEIADKKKEIGKRVREIDSNMNDRNLLKEEFEKRNKELNEKEKIFSLSDFSDLMSKERAELMEELKEYSFLMEPMTYVSKKNDILEKLKIIQELELEEDKKGKTYGIIIELQKEFLEAFQRSIKKAETKKEVLDLIYKFRYYKRIPVKKDILVKDITDISEDIDKTQKLLITKACKLKILNILSNDININFNLISNLLDTKIIDLDEVVIEFEKKENKTILNIYEDNMIENTKEYEYIEDLNIRYNKKMKLFI